MSGRTHLTSSLCILYKELTIIQLLLILGSSRHDLIDEELVTMLPHLCNLSAGVGLDLLKLHEEVVDPLVYPVEPATMPKSINHRRSSSATSGDIRPPEPPPPHPTALHGSYRLS